MISTPGALCRNTPRLTVIDNRGLAIRDVRYHRHHDTLTQTDERITRHHYTAQGALARSIDPRLFALQQADTTVCPNVAYRSSLTGNPLRTDSVDAGTHLMFSDSAGRQLLTVLAAGLARTFEYEGIGSPGRLLSITEQVAGNVARVTERFIWANHTAAQQNRNLAGLCVRHYDTAGLDQTHSIALTGTPLAVSRQFLQEPLEADWQGDESAFKDLMAVDVFMTRSTADAMGSGLTRTDAFGNVQRQAYDSAGQLKGSWLTLEGQAEQVIVASVTYSAQGKKLREEQGNGVVTTYSYDAANQRLIGIKTERPASHASGARLLQDLRYEYDPVGNVVLVHNDAQATRFWRNQKVIPQNTYGYDSLYQLTEATGRQMASIGQPHSQLPSPLIPLAVDDSVFTRYTRAYTYDRGDNLQKIRHSAPATDNNYTTDITISSRSNRAVLSSLAKAPDKVDELFDRGGHQLQLFAGQHLSWNPRGELQQVNPVVREDGASDNERYRYASDGLRVTKTAHQLSGNNTQVQRVIYLPGVERRTTHSGDTLKEDLRTVTLGEAGRAQVRVLHWAAGPTLSNDQVRYSYDNLIGSSGLEVDAYGEVISEEEYYPFGGTSAWAVRNQAEVDYKTIRYSGRERDATGLYYYGHRYYQSWVGRWLSADPAGTVDGLNLYLMVRNNPITFKDTLGLMTADENEQVSAAAPVAPTNLFKPEVFKVPFALIETLAEKLKLTSDKPKHNILYISAKPNPFSIDMTEKATAEFASKKMSYLTHKGHQVTGGYANTVQELTDTWNAIGTGELAGITKVILDYHGSISPKRGQQGVVILGSTSELLDKDAIGKLESKSTVETVSLYTCFSGFVDQFNPAVGLLEKLTSPTAHAVGFDAQGDNDMRSMKVNRHPQAGGPFDNALKALGITRTQYGRVKYTKHSETEVELEYQQGRTPVKTQVELRKYFG